MEHKKLFDQFNRRITYLRMSVTDRCNYRCTYCMPKEGLRELGRYQLLTLEELSRIGRVFVDEGLKKIRLTGGEPLLRNDLHLLVKDLSSLDGLKDLCLTTNGHLLEKHIETLAQAGLQRINVSIDTLNPEKFRKITRGGTLQCVLDGLKKTEDMLPGSVKINVVACKNFNEDEVLDFARMTLDYNYTVRFIEQMPMSSRAAWERGQVLSVIDIREEIEACFGLEPLDEDHHTAGPASRFRIPNAKGELGFIGAVTDEFCARCNRIRLTPDGKLRGCLMSDGEVDFLTPLRQGATDEDIREMLFNVLANKPKRHYINDLYFIRPMRTMSQIGG